MSCESALPSIGNARDPRAPETFDRMQLHLPLNAPIARMGMRVASELLLACTKALAVSAPMARPEYHRPGVGSLRVRTET